MGPFNTREIASVIWILVFALWAFRIPDVRKSINRVFQTFFQYKVLLPVILMTLYIIGVIACLHVVGMWEIELLKDSVIWFFTGAMAMMMRFVTADDATNIFQQIFEDSIKIVILLEFLMNFYTFSIGIELVLVPFITIVVMLDALASTNNEYATVEKLTKVILGVTGFLIVGIAVAHAIQDFQNFSSWDSFRSIALAPILSMSMFPFIYMAIVFSQYELVFLRLKFNHKINPELKRYARRQIMMFAGFSLNRLQYLVSNHAIDLMQIEQKADINIVFSKARAALRS